MNSFKVSVLPTTAFSSQKTTFLEETQQYQVEIGIHQRYWDLFETMLLKQTPIQGTLRVGILSLEGEWKVRSVSIDVAELRSVKEKTVDDPRTVSETT